VQMVFEPAVLDEVLRQVGAAPRDVGPR
jgi:hypothetical protein